MLLLSACAVPDQLNLRLIGRDASGAASEARLPPPGLDRPSPNLASVPPIPERPDFAARQALTLQLQMQRDELNTPLPDRRPDSRPTEGAISGQPPIAAAPPRPPALARAAIIPWTTQNAAPVSQPVAQPAPRDTTPGEVQPDQPPQLIPPVITAPEEITPGAIPDLPSADLLAPARPR